jgi:hypothetical protein
MSKERYPNEFKGHKVFELNVKTVNIKIVEPIGECEPDCIYVTALNAKNADRRFIKKIAMFKKLNELNIQFHQFRNGGIAVNLDNLPKEVNLKQLLK